MASHTATQQPVQAIGVHKWIAMVLVYLFIPALLFICAGTLAWWQAWVYSLLVFTAGIAGRILAERRHPGLLAERTRTDLLADAKPWDRVLSPLMSISIAFPIVIVAGLDHRFGWSPLLPLWLNIAGLLLAAVGYGFAVGALVENRFFSGVVRIQLDRGHVVCDSGPYRIVRHPGYAGNALSLPGITLALSSLWTFVPAAVALVIVVFRTALEDRTLQVELPGYADYARRVRYRLLPWVW